MEEKEALAIQQQMAQQLDEGDFGLDFITHLKVTDGILLLMLCTSHLIQCIVS